MKALSLRRADTCADCAAALPVGADAFWDAETRTVHCTVCAATSPVDSSAGASARREHGRRVAARERRVRARFPRLGGVVLAVTKEPATTRVWEQGAKGEEAVGAALDSLADVIALHDRRMIGANGRPTRANIDHLVVAASGLWVVDAKTHYGPLEVRRSGGILTPRVERLFINNRDQTRLVDGLQQQMATVDRILREAGHDVPVHGALCFVGTTLPWVSESIAGIPLIGRRGLTKILQAEGSLAPEMRAQVAAVLASRFLAA